MAVDPRYGNSSGYFKDPVSEQDLSVDTPRVVPCSFENGKFTWPMVMCSDGEQLLKIVYKLFTEQEKDLYKAYRGRSGTGHSQVKREPKPKVARPQVSDKSDEPVEVVKYSKDSATSLATLETLAICDRVIGISWIAGVCYALIGNGINKVYHIPRECIPDEEFERLSNG